MMFTTAGGEFRRSIEWIAKLCPGRPAWPPYGGILLEASLPTLSVAMRAFDGNTAGQVVTPVAGVTGGRALVSGRLLSAVAAVIPAGGDVTVATGQRADMEITCPAGSWTLPLMEAQDFPTLPSAGPAACQLEGSALAAALARVLPAADRDGNPQQSPFGGVAMAIDAETGTLTLAATDHYRAAIATVATVATQTAELLVPVEVLTAAAACSEGVVEIGCGGNVISVSTPHRRITGRRISPEWDGWRKLYRYEPVVSARIQVAEVRACLDRVLVMSEDKQPTRMDVIQGGLVLEARRGGKEAVTHAALSELDGDPVSVAINPRYLRDALAALHSSEARISWCARGTHPVILSPLDDDSYTHYVMTYRLDTVPTA